MDEFDLVIIGGGMSGLAAGIRAAQFQKSVLILEQHERLGGLNSFYQKDGRVYDVGLHAVTNWLTPGYRGPRLPLQRVYRQLRLRPSDFELEPQRGSSVRFGGTRLSFSNGLEELQAEVRRVFPGEADRFDKLCAELLPYPAATEEGGFVSARAFLESRLKEPLLIEMLLLPLMYYGSAHEHDVDLEQFKILFNSIYREGFCRPRRGVRQILKALAKRYRAVGGRVKKNAKVERIVAEGGRVKELRLEGGARVRGRVVMSSAGRVETARLLGEAPAPELSGQLSFVEHIWVLDQDPRRLGFEDCICFFNHDEGRPRWARPELPVDLNSGVLCVPTNYDHAPPLEDHVLRATHLADHRAWMAFSEEDYAAQKARSIEASAAVVTGLGGDFSAAVTQTDAFTPKTVRRFTGHENGAVYGSPHKQKSGQTGLDNLFICGTDQGFVGIVGAMLSGINMANAYALR